MLRVGMAGRAELKRYTWRLGWAGKAALSSNRVLAANDGFGSGCGIQKSGSSSCDGGKSRKDKLTAAEAARRALASGRP